MSDIDYDEDDFEEDDFEEDDGYTTYYICEDCGYKSKEPYMSCPYCGSANISITEIGRTYKNSDFAGLDDDELDDDEEEDDDDEYESREGFHVIDSDESEEAFSDDEL